MPAVYGEDGGGSGGGGGLSPVFCSSGGGLSPVLFEQLVSSVVVCWLFCAPPECSQWWWPVSPVVVARICCSSGMFLRCGGYCEDLEPVGYEDRGRARAAVGLVDGRVGVGQHGARESRGCTLGRRCVPEDIGFFETLSKHGQTKKFDPAEYVGGAISNAPGAKRLKKNERFEAACLPCRHRATPYRHWTALHHALHQRTREQEKMAKG